MSSRPILSWTEGRRRPVADGTVLFAFTTGDWRVRQGDGTLTVGHAADLRSAMRRASEGQAVERAPWRRYVAAELPGDLWLAVLAIADDQWAWFFSWSRFGPFSGRADSLEAAKEAVAAHVTAEIMTPLWLQYRRWGYALNAAAIPQNEVLVRERRQLVSERRHRGGRTGTAMAGVIAKALALQVGVERTERLRGAL